jgi:pimeloyl-ACP methyl ester carboxylesterase
MKALRESMRRFSADSDRVFLQGHGMGADVAYDVGTSHPEHWAGVIGVSATGIQKYPLIYAENTGNRLPIYAVVGERHIGSIRGCKDAWNKWLTSKKRNACTVVQYLGRLDEQFREDVPEAFKWMRAQRRRSPDKTGFEFVSKSIRPADNYFWFLEIHGFPRRNIQRPELFRQRRGINVLEIKGEIRSGRPNVFVVGKAGTGVTLWLRPDYFDFEREIQINGPSRRFTGSVTPSRAVLLEDARTRCDFQRPYWAKLDYEGGTWVP